ncbi:cytokine receptor-like [Pectinophora gossypiella]|uniref:Fibronectin type-III domain-containing protein n=1 Tax=Pectinophora gossypiella TaxID=13191 RepID=A0A1E1WQB5_PECGO|nr:cytokine receptor-like [Pectinophora gossypiella]
MAEPCIYTNKRTKCSGLRGLKCQSWICCAILYLCIIASCAAEREENTVFMFPKGDLYVRHGDNLEMFCIAGMNYTAKDLSFTLSGKILPSKIINSTTIRLFIEKPKEQYRQTYYCRNSISNKVELKTVYVASPPAEVKDFKCISRNIDVLNCTWSTPDLIIFTNYSLTFLFNGNAVKPCIANTVQNSLMRYCYWNTTSAPRYRQLEDTYYFLLESQNVFGNRTQNFTIDHYSVVKPDPPMNLKNISVSPHSVLLQWTIPYNIHHFLPSGIEHKIEYQIAKIDDTSVFRQIDTSSLPANNKTYKFNLTNLPYAHRQYGVRVYIKPKRAQSDEFWSDFNNLVFYTASERPAKPPDMMPGSFDQSRFQDGRLLNIYWKQLEEYEEAGANFTYKVLVTQGMRTKTYEPDKNKSLGYLSLNHLDVESLEAMEVRVHSFNEMGFSINSSYLYIPAEKDTRSLRLTLFTKLAYENGTYELSWAGSGYNIDNYTLFWCPHNTTNICTGRINFTYLEATKNKHIINLSRDYRYQFAISANKGMKTSGMTWAKCDISKDGIAMFDFPIHFVDHDAPGKTYVKLKWSMDCTLKEGIINGYNITYCPVFETTTMCDNSLGHLPKPYIINNSKQMEATITDLRPYTTYQFTMALNTTYGLKTIENTTVRITTLEDTPTKPRNVKIFDIEYDSLFISWDLPAHLNGHISQIKYVIKYNDRNRTVKYEDNKSFIVKLTGLTGFTNYTITLQACNEGISSCSEETDPILLRTRIGPPSKMISPTFNNNILSWQKPLYVGGTLDQYQVKIVKDAGEEILLNTTDLSHYVTSCEGAVQNVTYQVRAINFDMDGNHGAWTDSENVSLPSTDEANILLLTFYGDWSNESTVLCKSRDNLFLLFIIMGVLAAVGVGCGVLKTYKKIRKMGDIKPEFPKGLFVPEKEIAKYPFTGIYPSDKDEKPMSDEMLLLPNSKSSSIPSPDIKNTDNDNCASSERTDSTALSDTSQGPVERQNSTSDESTHSSLHLEVEAPKPDENNAKQKERDITNIDTDTCSESSPYFSDNAFKKNKATGYVQPVISPATGYVQAVPTTFNHLPVNPVSQPTTSSYVMAGLPPPIFTTGIPRAGGTSQLPPSGYVRAEDVDARAAMNFPKLGPSPTKVFGPESLPTLPTLPQPPKHAADSSYIQLQSLDSLPSHKPTLRNTVPFKPAASSGYVRPEDAVINKHLNNFISGSQPSEESAILDPTMSPDAYCRFSWSTDPNNDNLHSILANSPGINPSKN